MARWQRWALGLATLVAWAILMGVSLAANFKFAWNLGSTEFDKQILGAGSIASDIFKAAAPIALLWMWSKRNWPGIAAVASIGLTATIFSLMAATGFMAGERFHAFYSARSAHEATKAKRAEIAKAETNRDWLPTHKPLSVLEAEMEMHKTSPGWASSKGCTAQKGPGHFELCKKVGETNVAIAAAKEAAKADATIALARNDIATKGRDYDDPLFEVLQRWTGVPQETLLIVVVALGVLLIELGSGLGLTFALGLLVPDTTKLGRVLSIVRPSTPKEEAKPMPPEAAAVARVAGLAEPRPFPAPVAGNPAGGGLRGKMRAVPAEGPRRRA